MTDPRIEALSAVEVQDPLGAKVRVGRLWTRQPVLLVMIRQFG